MKSNLPDRGLVREYLLGRLDDKKEIEDHLSDGILFNDELFEKVESIEDEIIEEFLDGTLNSADKKAVDEYFLRPSTEGEVTVRPPFATSFRERARSFRQTKPGCPSRHTAGSCSAPG